ncbi:hypothetical protein ACFQ1E_08805 [Sphingomonas canadensis]|uniref:Uncharacterized protein n=1 Tax=Sphingomonas canadensis TaxID=1219257 RepID=A0ABW3HAV2_9SPHN|nr:hypothetical protein [Sphingomonas canadensis]MCW3836139.1 hypothetical protein [Sphingomonas canadensis]
MRQALVALIVGTVLSGLAAAYASSIPMAASERPAQRNTAN